MSVSPSLVAAIKLKLRRSVQGPVILITKLERQMIANSNDC